MPLRKFTIEAKIFVPDSDDAEAIEGVVNETIKRCATEVLATCLLLTQTRYEPQVTAQSEGSFLDSKTIMLLLSNPDTAVPEAT